MADDLLAKLAAAEARHAALRAELAALDETLSEIRLEARYGPRGGAQSPPVPETVPPPVEVQAPPPLPPAPVPVIERPQPRVEGDSLEMKVGRVWLARVGILIVLTGLVFLGSYAWQALAGQLGSFIKLGLLYSAGGLLTGVGLYLERRGEAMRGFSRILIAGGLAAIYYTTYAAHYSESLRVIASPTLATGLLLGVALGIGWMADRRNSQPLGSLAVALAFYASAVNPPDSFTLVSNAILCLATLGLVWRRKWMGAPFLALVGAYVSYLHWLVAPVLKSWRFWEFDGGGQGGLGLKLGFLLTYWLTFTAIVFLARRSDGGQRVRIVFSTLNDGAFFLLAASAICGEHGGVLWLVAGVFGLLQTGLAAVEGRLGGRDGSVAQSFAAKAIFFFTLALCVKFTGDHLAVLLVVEAVLLSYAHSRLRLAVLAVLGALAGVLAAVVAGISLTDAGSPWAPALVAGILMVIAWFGGRRGELTASAFILAFSGVWLASGVLLRVLPDSWDAAGPAVLALVLVGTAWLHGCRGIAWAALSTSFVSTFLLIAGLETSGFWPTLVPLVAIGATAGVGIRASGDGFKVFSGLLAFGWVAIFWWWTAEVVPAPHQFWFAALTGALVLSMASRNSLMLTVGCVLTFVAFAIFLGHFFAPRFLWADVVGCVLLLGQERVSRRLAHPAFIANACGILGLVSALGWVTQAVGSMGGSVPLTVAWALLALVLFFAGLLLSARLFRLGGLAILGLSVVRIVMFDVWGLDLALRIVTFLVLGTVLLLLGFLYNRYEAKIRQWL